MADKVLIVPTFRLDVSGKLFRNKKTNMDIQETIIFNNFMTRLSITKGDLPTFPEVGLKQFFGRFGFVDEIEANVAIAEFEEEIEHQMQRDCKISSVKDVENKHIDIMIQLEGIEAPLNIRYFNNNGSIRIIEPQFDE